MKGTAILLEARHPRSTHIGNLSRSGELKFDSLDVTGPICTTVTGMDIGVTNSFRLLFRKNMFEMYLDDLLVQTYITSKEP